MLAWLFGSILAWSAVAVPPMTSPVVDLSNVIAMDQKMLIESELRSFANTGKAQIQILIIPTLDGEAIETYSMRAVEQWKIGDQKKDNGVLILVVTQDKKSRIEVGGGVEGELTDIQSKRILADQARPYFQRGDFESGVKVAAAGVIDQLNGLAPEPKAQQPEGRSGNKGAFWLFIIFFFILPMFSRRRMGSRSGLAAGLLGGLLGGGMRGGGGGWGSGGGGSWGGGGGGFSGGGSSDSW